MIFAMDIMELMAELTSERKLDIFCICGSFFPRLVIAVYCGIQVH